MHADDTATPKGVFATDGLVIDVRGSFGGGSRKIVQALVPFFLTNVDRRNCPLIGTVYCQIVIPFGMAINLSIPDQTRSNTH